MARSRSEEVKTERYASLRKNGREQSRVKAWQYYSIFEFCRECGETRDGADKVARWCRNANPTDSMERDGYAVVILEQRLG